MTKDAEAEAASQERLDQLVARQHQLSRSVAARLIEDGEVTVNGSLQRKAAYKVKDTDSIRVNLKEDQVFALAIELPVLYEDRDCVVVNKPAGVLTHSKGAFNPEATVASWLSARLRHGMIGDRAGIVHRLDRATSGVMVCAKTPEALNWLQKQFSQRKVKKTYMAVVEGMPDQRQAVIDMPIERNPKKPQTFRVGVRGKPAVTAYSVLRTDGRFSLLELQPTTGRTHQLRVHLQKLGHPIAGDTLYGGQPAERLFLHARQLEITLPNRHRKVFSADTPQEFEGQVH